MEEMIVYVLLTSVRLAYIKHVLRKRLLLPLRLIY